MKYDKLLNFLPSGWKAKYTKDYNALPLHAKGLAGSLQVR